MEILLKVNSLALNSWFLEIMTKTWGITRSLWYLFTINRNFKLFTKTACKTLKKNGEPDTLINPIFVGSTNTTYPTASCCFPYIIQTVGLNTKCALQFMAVIAQHESPFPPKPTPAGQMQPWPVWVRLNHMHMYLKHTDHRKQSLHTSVLQSPCKNKKHFKSG